MFAHSSALQMMQTASMIGISENWQRGSFWTECICFNDHPEATAVISF
jgi:hypothetical protein